MEEFFDSETIYSEPFETNGTRATVDNTPKLDDETLGSLIGAARSSASSAPSTPRPQDCRIFAAS